MTATTERAILAGGCFWGMQQLMRRLPGVVSTRVGYSGGNVRNATYSNHGTHAEAIEITFDPSQTSFRALLEFFFQIHDPTTPNRQGNDRGTSYRSAIFYTSEETPRRRGHHRRRRGLRAVAGQGRDRALARWRFLGGGARAPGLPRTLSERLHLPLRPPGLEVAAEKRRLTATAVSPACGARSLTACVHREAFAKDPRRPGEVAHNATRWRGLDQRRDQMTTDKITQNMEVIGADGVHVGTVDGVANGRIRLAKRDSGEGQHKGHAHFIDLGLVADVEGQKVRLSANAAVAVTFEEEPSGKPV